MKTPSRILAIDPGDKRLGFAVSDPTGTIATPLTVIEHQSTDKDVQEIIDIARKYNAGKIVIGQALDWDSSLSEQGKKSSRLAAAIKEKTPIPVVLWNEYGTTQTAQKARIEMGLSRKKRAEPIDHLAATLILQSYLDAQENEPGTAHE
jgi:putative Holliday junction resolvase